VQLGSNRLTVAFRTNCNNNGATELQTLCRRSWIQLGKIGHGCGLSHPTSEPTRLPRGVTDRVALRSHGFRLQQSLGLRNVTGWRVTVISVRLQASLGDEHQLAQLGCCTKAPPIRTSSASRSIGCRKTSCCYARTRGPCASCRGPRDSCR
jgi:hypothetical protein